MPDKIPPDVAEAFDAFPPKVRRRLLAVRKLILETARKTDGVGPLTETLKWGQPAYLTSNKSGTTVRLGGKAQDPDYCALFVPCSTSLVEDYKTLFDDDLAFEGNRAVLLDPDRPLPRESLKVCISMALTYHARQKRR